MNFKTNIVLTTALLCCMGARAQTTTTPAYDFRAVVQTGTVIGGHTFTLATRIGGAALNDAGEVAFIASGTGPSPDAVFTSRHIVASQGDVIDGKTIVQIFSTDAGIAINEAGQVAWEGWYTGSNGKGPWGRGIFVGNRLVFAAPFDSELPAFTLTEDGRIVTQSSSPSPAPAAKANSNILGRIGIKLPKGLPLTISPSPNKPERRLTASAKQSCSSPFPTNRNGEILIPVNFDRGGFLLLIGTPMQH